MNDSIIGSARLSGGDAVKLLEMINSGKTKGDNGLPPRDVQVLRLQEAFRQLQEKHEFKLGDLVQVRPALYGPLNYPKPGQPAIITKIHSPGLTDKEAGLTDPGFGRVFDVSLSVCVDDGRIVEFAYYSEHLEPYQGQ